MAVRCLVLDFDGTLTDVEKEGAPFLARFQQMVADLLGRANVDVEWAVQTKRIEATPQQFGWQYGGQIVAPATADPYILATTVAQEILTTANVLVDPATRSTVVQALYQKAYESAGMAFREEARAVLEDVLARDLTVTFVTNAKEDVVKEKLAKLAPKGYERIVVRGAARKYVIAPPASGGWDGIPDQLQIAQLSRPILLHRGHYMTALRETLRAADAKAEEMLVCGDIFELDLALPLEMGASAHLVSSKSTPAYELAAIQQRPRATAGTLTDLLERL